MEKKVLLNKENYWKCSLNRKEKELEEIKNYFTRHIRGEMNEFDQNFNLKEKIAKEVY